MSPKACIGIDNGFTGAMALLGQNQIFCRPVPVTDLGNYRLLDVEECTRLLQEMVAMAKTPLETVLVVFEQSSIVPKFGAKNNYLNGQNNEFWRVLLVANKVPFTWVNAQKPSAAKAAVITFRMLASSSTTRMRKGRIDFG